MIVTYLGHSGFLVELKRTYLLFDYFTGKLPELSKEKELILLGHVHHDHYCKRSGSCQNNIQKCVMFCLKIFLTRMICRSRRSLKQTLGHRYEIIPGRWLHNEGGGADFYR